jgi:hypothetical protein
VLLQRGATRLFARRAHGLPIHPAAPTDAPIAGILIPLVPRVLNYVIAITDPIGLLGLMGGH